MCIIYYQLSMHMKRVMGTHEGHAWKPVEFQGMVKAPVNL